MSFMAAGYPILQPSDMKRFYILLLIILLASCDVSLMDSGENTFPTPVPVPSYDGLHPYEPASIGSVVTEGRLVEVPYGFSQMSDEQILSLCYPSISEFLGKGFLAVLFEALGVDDDSILSSDYVTARSRSVTFNAELHALDEGVVVWKGYDEKAYVDLDFLDVIAECTSPSAVRFLLKFIDGDEWNYSSNDANVSGSFGLSLDAGIRKAGSDSDEVPEVELKGYLDTSFSSVFLDAISMKVNGNDLEIHFPDILVRFRIIQGKYVRFPFLDIAHNTFPSAPVRCCKNLVVFLRLHRFKAEYLYMRPCIAAKMQPCRHHFSIIEHHYGIVRQHRRNIEEMVLLDIVILVNKQFGRIPSFERIFCNPVIREGIIIVFYPNVRYHISFNFGREYSNKFLNP